jgi:CxxC motif-containing protein (DUF1111 family)
LPPAAPDAGGAINGINAPEFAAWFDGGQLFGEVFSVSGIGTTEPGVGLGPNFNGNSCEMCHATPAPGGTGPSTVIDKLVQQGTFFPNFGPVPNNAPNQQFGLATLDGATNSVPFFITQNGPTREARFKFLADGTTPDGGVHDLYSIKGRVDAEGCLLPQNDFSNTSNIIFRIPTPTFGVGLVENTPDQMLLNNLKANAGAKQLLGISGRVNRSGNDGSIARFGWKAQNKSLLLFAGEASNVELGVTNEIFSTERLPLPNQQAFRNGCTFNATPEDVTGIEQAVTPPPPPPLGNPGEISSFTTRIAIFMRLNAPPTAHPEGYSTATQTVTAAQIAAGRAIFDIPSSVVPATATLTVDTTDPTSVADSLGTATGIGCALCHTPSLRTSKSPFVSLNNVQFAPFSDFALHNMGSGLADGISQGVAAGNEFRTAPLWGLGQRVFLLHDGRFGVGSLQDVILAHESTGSEANAVIERFKALTVDQKNNLLAFLRSL